MQVPKAYAVLESEEKDALICRIEIVPKQCVTVFGRVNDDHKRWADEMQEMIAVINPDTKAHFDDETRAGYHPYGSPKKIGYKYFHHCHIPWDRADEVLPKIEKWMPVDFKLVEVGNGV